MTHVLTARNVNDAFATFKVMARVEKNWRKIAPRGLPTMEHEGPFTTEYLCPTERVLFCASRDANPFFHFFEALWILDGRDDVEFLAKFNSNISQFSDDGKTFHAPYGYRIRNHFRARGTLLPIDQLTEAVRLLRLDKDSRQIVMSIWDPRSDLGTITKDVPCNDLVMFKVRDGKLDMTVCCRSNDAVWGCYGANVVQFSTLQEFVALAVGVQIGRYRQISDSFHFYHERDDWKRIRDKTDDIDQYGTVIDDEILDTVRPHELMHADTNYMDWLQQLSMFTRNKLGEYRGDIDPFFTMVASPLLNAWLSYRPEVANETVTKNSRINIAQGWLRQCFAGDWRLACHAWLERRRER